MLVHAFCVVSEEMNTEKNNYQWNSLFEIQRGRNNHITENTELITLMPKSVFWCEFAWNFDYVTPILKILITDCALAGLLVSFSFEPMDSIMDSDESRQSEVCHFSRLLLVSFLSIVVAITIARETKELKQLEECMMETQVDSKNRTRYIVSNVSKWWNHIKQQYTRVTESRVIINDAISVARRYFLWKMKEIHDYYNLKQDWIERG